MVAGIRPRAFLEKEYCTKDAEVIKVASSSVWFCVPSGVVGDVPAHSCVGMEHGSSARLRGDSQFTRCGQAALRHAHLAADR